MKIYIEKSIFETIEPYACIEGIGTYMDILLENGFEYDELPNAVLEIYFLDYFIAQVNNGGLTQFFRNAAMFEIDIIPVILKGLESVKDVEVQKLLTSAAKALFEQEESLFNTYVYGNWYYKKEKLEELPALKKLYELHEKLTSDFYNHVDHLEILVGNYVKKLENLCVVPDDQYEDCMNELVKSNLRREERLKERGSPTEIFELICKKFGQQFVSFGSMDFGQSLLEDEKRVNDNIDQDIRFAYIVTDQGEHYIKIQANKASLFETKTRRQLGELDLNKLSRH